MPSPHAPGVNPKDVSELRDEEIGRLLTQMLYLA